MPNRCTNKILFDAKHAEMVASLFLRDGCVHFERLVPCPPNMYRGNLSIQRTEKRRDRDADRDALSIELWDFDPSTDGLLP